MFAEGETEALGLVSWGSGVNRLRFFAHGHRAYERLAAEGRLSA